MDRHDRRRQTRCSFCGKSQEQVKKLVAGPGVFICDRCIVLCNEVIAQGPSEPSQHDASARGGWVRMKIGWLRRRWGHFYRSVTAPTA